MLLFLVLVILPTLTPNSATAAVLWYNIMGYALLTIVKQLVWISAMVLLKVFFGIFDFMLDPNHSEARRGSCVFQ